MARIEGAPPHAGSVEVWLQRRDAAGGFEAAAVCAVGADPTRLVAADIDGDGLNDLVLGARERADVGAAGTLSALRNDAAQPGRFVAVQQLAMAVHASACAAADVDVDGRSTSSLRAPASHRPSSTTASRPT